jgi:TRAP-type C4-dicarboxylate transport system permease large subunit
MGLALFLVADIAQVKMKDVLREMVPYYVPLLATLALITFFPALSLWLPRWAMG